MIRTRTIRVARDFDDILNEMKRTSNLSKIQSTSLIANLFRNSGKIEEIKQRRGFLDGYFRI